MAPTTMLYAEKKTMTKKLSLSHYSLFLHVNLLTQKLSSSVIAHVNVEGGIDSKTQYLGFRLVAPEKKRKEIITLRAASCFAGRRQKLPRFLMS